MIFKPMDWLRRTWRRMLVLEDTPRAIALGVGIGVFFCFSPVIGLKTALAILLAWLVGGNQLAAAIAVTLHDLVLPLMPLVYRFEYDLGYWMLSSPHSLPAKVHLGEWHFRELFDWHTFERFDWRAFQRIEVPCLLGSLVVGLPGALIAFWITKGIVWRFQAARHAKRTPFIE